MPAGEQLILMVILELPVPGQGGEKGRFVPYFRELDVIVAHLHGALTERQRDVDAGGRRLLGGQSWRNEVDRRDARKLVESGLHLPVVVHSIVGSCCLEGSVYVARLRVGHFDLLLRPEWTLDLLHPADAGGAGLV